MIVLLTTYTAKFVCNTLMQLHYRPTRVQLIASAWKSYFKGQFLGKQDIYWMCSTFVYALYKMWYDMLYCSFYCTLVKER
mgnify:FL=1